MHARNLILGVLLAVVATTTRAETIRLTIENRSAHLWHLKNRGEEPKASEGSESKRPVPVPVWHIIEPGATTQVMVERYPGHDHLMLALQQQTDPATVRPVMDLAMPLLPQGGPGPGDAVAAPAALLIDMDGLVQFRYIDADPRVPPPSTAIGPVAGKALAGFQCRFCEHECNSKPGIQKHERVKHDPALVAQAGRRRFSPAQPKATSAPAKPTPSPVLPVGRAVVDPSAMFRRPAVSDPAQSPTSSVASSSPATRAEGFLDWAAVANLVRPPRPAASPSEPSSSPDLSFGSPASSLSGSRKRGREPEPDLGVPLPPAARETFASDHDLREAYLEDLGATAVPLGAEAGEILGDFLGVQAPILVHQDPLPGGLPQLVEAVSRVGTKAVPPGATRALRFKGGYYSVLLATPPGVAPAFIAAPDRTFVETGEVLAMGMGLRTVPADGHSLAASIFFLRYGKLPLDHELLELRKVVVDQLRDQTAKVDERVREAMTMILQGASTLGAGSIVSWGPCLTGALMRYPEFASRYPDASMVQAPDAEPLPGDVFTLILPHD